jgi:hypothetical protein
VNTSEASFFADWQVFGNSQNAVVANAVAAAGAGTILEGPGGLDTIIGAEDRQGTARGLQIGIGNGVELVADTDADDASFIAMSKHTLGDTYYAVDGDSTASYFDQVSTDAGVTLTASTNLPPASTTFDDLAGVAGPSGNNWSAK